MEAREQRGIKDIAISRVEQLSPFPYELITPHLDKYPNASLLWCQEEPLNNGAWSYVGPRIYTAAGQTEHHKGKYPLYAGRDPTSSVATGSKASVLKRYYSLINANHANHIQLQHKKETEAFINDAFDLSR